MEFTELNLHPDLERGLSEAGYITCMPVQEQVLKHAFSGQDLYVQSQTGTGKTAAFLIVVFQRLLTEDMLHGKKAIIMVPTRELAVQVEEEAKLLGKYLPFKIGSFYGGVGYTQQSALLRDNVQILVGTPGRVLDLNQGGQMNLMDIAFLIIDEADRMFDMGFYPDLRKLIRAVPPADRRQTMLFSATLNAWVKNLAWEYTRNPFEIAIEPEMVTVEEVEQVLYHVSSADKMKLLLGILKKENPDGAIIFCNTKRYVEVVAKRLRMNGYECEFIMGDLPQPKRLKIIDDIKAGKLRFLVATDVAARGLDIEDLAMVINYDLPNESENYVHRIGRTARAGKTGKAITLASEQDVYELPAIERYIGRKLPSETAPADLLAEDASEGKRIQTEFYEERPGREGRPRPPRRGAPGARREGESSFGQRERSREKSRGGRRDQEAQGDRPGRGERQGRKNQRRFQESGSVNQWETKEPESAVKLSELSLEDRMAYYRQKYDRGGPPRRQPRNNDGKKTEKETGSRPSKANGSRRSEKPGGRKDRRQGQDKEKGKGRYAGQEQPAGSTAAGSSASANSAAGNQAASSAPPETAAQGAAKKGLLARIKGIFKKK